MSEQEKVFVFDEGLDLPMNDGGAGDILSAAVGLTITEAVRRLNGEKARKVPRKIRDWQVCDINEPDDPEPRSPLKPRGEL